MNIGEAIEAIKKGKKVTREGWNGKGQYIELATNISYMPIKGEEVNVNHDAIGNNAIAFVGTSGVQLGWLASQADLLADDWKEIEIDEQKINIGDEIKSQSGTIAVVLHIDGWKRLCCIQTSGRAFFIDENCYNTYWKKTGRHTDNVDKLLKGMKGV